MEVITYIKLNYFDISVRRYRTRTALCRNADFGPTFQEQIYFIFFINVAVSKILFSAQMEVITYIKLNYFDISVRRYRTRTAL